MLYTLLNKLILRWKPRHSLLCIKKRAKLHIKKSASVQHINGKPTLGYGDCTIARFTQTRCNLNLMSHSQLILNGNSMIGLGNVYTLEENTTLSLGICARATIRVANKATISNNIFILERLNIGDNAIIAAGSIVTKNVPDGSVVASNPAKIIKSGVTPINPKF